MQDLWNSKFGRTDFLYGKEVNAFIKENAHLVRENSRILLLGEGEGRNAIFFAKKDPSLHIEALDASDVGLQKLQKRAREENVAITIRHTLIEHWKPYGEYNAIITTFLHLHVAKRNEMLQKAFDALCSGGYFIAEFFSQEQLHYKSGGPKDLDLLYRLDDVLHFFEKLPCEIHKLSQELTHLSEGKGHVGEASVIRVIIKKI